MKKSNFQKKSTCRGSYILGTACGHCGRCDKEMAKITKAKALMDLKEKVNGALAEKPAEKAPVPMEALATAMDAMNKVIGAQHVALNDHEVRIAAIEELLTL